MKETHTHFLSECESLRKSVLELSGKLDALHSSEVELQNHIKDTTTALSAVGLPTTPPNTSNAADIVDELLDHERRKSNLIIYGAPEPAGSTFTECRSNDNAYLSSLLSTEFKIDTVEISKSSRLGKQIEGKTRPLLITLTENKTRSSILRNAKNLHKSSTYQNVFISHLKIENLTSSCIKN